MGDDVVSDGLGLGVELHDALVEDVVLGLDIGLFLVHTERFQLGLLQRVLEHDLLLV